MPFFVIFRSVRKKLQITVFLDHPVHGKPLIVPFVDLGTNIDIAKAKQIQFLDALASLKRIFESWSVRVFFEIALFVSDSLKCFKRYGQH